MKEALRSRLLADSAIAAIVGQNVAWDDRPRADGLPALVLAQIAPGRDYTHDGADALQMPWVQFDLFAADAATLNALEAAIIAEMETQPVTVGGIKFGMGFLEASRTMPTDVLDGNTIVRARMLEFRFWFELV